MREIKLRAWDKYLQRFQNPDYINCNGECFDWSLEPRDGLDFEPDRYILVQYIGRKDINSKEICEGDIVKINGYGVIDLITDIYWDEALAGFYSRNLYEQDTFEHSMSCIEVIGNIFENPELKAQI